LDELPWYESVYHYISQKIHPIGSDEERFEKGMRDKSHFGKDHILGSSGDIYDLTNEGNL